MDDAKIRSTKITTEQNSQVVEKIVDQLVSKYNTDLQQVIDEIKLYIFRVQNNPNVEFDIVTLEHWMMKVPTFLYFAGSGLELLGIEGDNASAIKDEAFNSAYQAIEGTIGDKKAHAELETFNEKIVEIAFQRAYKKLKLQLQYAEILYKSISKIYGKRQEDEWFDRQEGKQIQRQRQHGNY